MNVLVSTIPGAGHIYPMVPLARALQDAGHDVRFGTTEPMRQTLADLGFELVPLGLPWTQQTVRDHIDLPDDAPMEAVMMEMFWEVGPRAVYASLTESDWPIDVIVVDPDDRGSRLWGEVNDVPWVNVMNYIQHGTLFGLIYPHDIEKRAGIDDRGSRATEERFRAELGLPPIPVLPGELMTDRFLRLDMAPTGIVPWEPELRVATAHPMQPVPHAADTPSRWLDRLDPDKATVHVAFGSLFSHSSTAFPTVIEALSDEAIQLVVSAPDGVDVGDPPADAIVEPWVNQGVLLPRCDVFVHHGGWGSTIAGLWHAVPSLVIPHGADQPNNARIIAACGAGQWLEYEDLATEDVRRATNELITEPVYGLNAQRIAGYIADMPTPADVVPLVEQVARTHEPVLSPSAIAMEARMQANEPPE